MIDVIPASDRHHADLGWLSTNYHFSFGDYYDPRNMNWGALRVFNDDVVAGGGGFDFHPHKDMEIITIVFDGELEHRDNLGHRGVIRPGDVQTMTAGRGIMHAEFNHSKTSPVHLAQLWIMPAHRGNEPRYGQQTFEHEARANRLLPVVSGGSIPGTLAIDQDAAIFVSSLQAGKSVTHAKAENRKPYVFVASGQVTVNGNSLSAGDQARISAERQLNITAAADAELILLDLPPVK